MENNNQISVRDDNVMEKKERNAEMFISDLCPASYSLRQVGVEKVLDVCVSVVRDQCSAYLVVSAVFWGVFSVSLRLSLPLLIARKNVFRFAISIIYNVSNSFLITNSQPEGWLAGPDGTWIFLVCPTYLKKRTVKG